MKNTYLFQFFAHVNITLPDWFSVACEKAFSRAGWGEGKATLSLPFPRYFSPNREPVHRLGSQ